MSEPARPTIKELLHGIDPIENHPDFADRIAHAKSMQYMATEKNPLFGRPRFNVYRTRAQCAHGPQKWPWWKWIAFRVSYLSTCLPTTGRSIWCYTRWGAIAFEMVIDRRGMFRPEGRGW